MGRLLIHLARVTTRDGESGPVVAEDVVASFAPIPAESFAADGYATTVEPGWSPVRVEVPHGAMVGGDLLLDPGQSARGYTGAVGPLTADKVLDRARRGLPGYRFADPAVALTPDGGPDHAA